MENRQLTIRISNEFTGVEVRKVFTRNGERLEIFSRKIGSRVVLDAMQLEALTLAKPTELSRFLEDPFGSDEE